MSCNQYPNCACANPAMCGNVLTPKQNGGFPTEQCEQIKHAQRVQHDIYRMAVEQGGGEVRRNNDVLDAVSYQSPQPGNRTPATNLDWEITQAIIHLKNAASVTDSNRAHLLLSAVQIAKGVRESE